MLDYCNVGDFRFNNEGCSFHIKNAVTCLRIILFARIIEVIFILFSESPLSMYIDRELYRVRVNEASDDL